MDAADGRDWLLTDSNEPCLLVAPIVGQLGGGSSGWPSSAAHRITGVACEPAVMVPPDCELVADCTDGVLK
jgi:hypothetical protein